MAHESQKTKVHNVYRTYRETKGMFMDETQDVIDLAERFSKLLGHFKERDGALEALASFGIQIMEED